MVKKNPRFLFLLWIMLTGMFWSANIAAAQDETIIQFVSENAKMEDNPKQNNYNITIFSPDGEWKVQLNYNSASMFGTFGNEEFNLAGNGKNYNYARNPKNDMVFYSFTDMNVTVSDEGTSYRVKANCLTKNKLRFIIEATIPNPSAQETVSDDLGYARIEPNAYMGTTNIYAENDNFKLAYGIADTKVIGTFYRADLLLPELTDKRTGKTITPTSATAVHVQNGDRIDMTIDILSEDLIMYHLTMFNGAYDVEVTQERIINIEQGVALQDLTEMYGCFQVAGINDVFGVAIALKPETVESGKTELTKEDIVMPYTSIVRLATNTKEDIFDVKAKLERNDDIITLKADILCMNGILYHVTMLINMGDPIPQTKETVNIDFGHVAVLDYSQGIGTVGIGAVKSGQYQMRMYLNTVELDGEYKNSNFILDACDVMVVNEDNYVFHDAAYVTANMEKDEDGRIYITADMIGVDEVCYHATMYIDPLYCMEEHEYAIGKEQDIDMVSIMEPKESGDGCEYNLQFQSNLDSLFDNTGHMIGRGQIFSFSFDQKENSVAGKYGYSDITNTLFPSSCIFYENNCEIRVAPVAGTLTLEPVRPIRLNLTNGGRYNTWVYNVSFEIVGQNAVLYSGKGQNYLICVSTDENFVEMNESGYTSIAEQLAKQGLRVRKILKGGKIIVETADGDYNLNGAKQ